VTVNNLPIILWFPLIHGDVTTMPCVIDVPAAELHLLFMHNGDIHDKNYLQSKAFHIKKGYCQEM